MTRALIILQNAWSPVYAGDIWPRESWLRALWRSRTGARIRVMIDDAGLAAPDVWVDNTTPAVGDEPSSQLPPDIPHIERLMREHAPEIVVACGIQAEHLFLRGPVAHTGTLIVVPHPASRTATNALFGLAAALIREARPERPLISILRQTKTGIAETTMNRKPAPGQLTFGANEEIR